MAKYITLKKAELVELCKSRDLATEGTKDVLVDRLEESDRLAKELETDTGVEEKSEATVVEEDNKEQPEPVAETAAEPVTDSVQEPVQEPIEEKQTQVPKAETNEEPKELSADELKELALVELKKRLARASKFGDETSSAEITKDIQRIERFGVSATSKIYFELTGKSPQKDKKVFKKRGHYKKNFGSRGKR